MFFIFAWCLKDERSFNESVPLDLISESWKRHGSTIPVTVVFLEGYSALSPGYLESLAAGGLKCMDYTDGYEAIVARFPRISSRYSRYERNCFLRWIAFQEVYAAQGATGQVWHLDGDVILHASTDSIAKDTLGKTFMLQGCPVLLSIADPRWFTIYAAELGKLEADIDGYSRQADGRRREISQRDRELCNVSLYRNPIGSDQDLLEYLISAGIQIQDRADRIFGSRFYFVQNPLVARFWDDLQAARAGARVEEDGKGGLRIGDRSIPFLHFQNDFCHYAAVWLAMGRAGLGWLTPYYIDPGGGGYEGALLPYRVLSKALRTMGLKMPTRRNVILALAKPRRPQGPARLVELINHINFRR